jgi:hypothetical protein
MFTFERAVAFWAVLAALPFITSVVYFRASRAVTPVARRIGVSAHGLVIAVLHLGAVYIAAAQLHGDQYRTLLLILCLVATGLIGYSFWAFRGNKQVHWLQVINVVWLLGLLFLGGMAVTGRWL